MKVGMVAFSLFCETTRVLCLAVKPADDDVHTFFPADRMMVMMFIDGHENHTV